MKNIYFTQVGFDFDGSVYLPYAVGTLIAYCSQFEEITRNYAFNDIIYQREKLETALEKIKEPYLVGFSSSVWNMEYNKALALSIKQKYPGCLTVFGGHSINEDASFSEIAPFADILMFGEGERTFYELLKALLTGDLSCCPNIAFRKNGEIVRTEKKTFDTLEGFASPYCTGVFDKIMRENPTADFLGVLETNRGCPYACAYCDWCAGKKTRLFPAEKVFSEIEWFAQHKIEYVFCADSNFGMFERDVDFAKALVNAKKSYGYPKVFRPCYEKNSDERVFYISSVLNEQGMDKGATLAYQTLSEQALDAIGRKNLTMEHFAALQKKYNTAGIPTYSELILGLPGETLKSFCQGICRLIESGQHNSISVYHCEVLPNAPMALEPFMKKYGIKVMKVPFNHIHSAIHKDEQIQEYSYLVRATDSLPENDWVEANMFSVCVQTFHALGLLRCFSVYLYYEQGISYLRFFGELLAYIRKNTVKLKKLFGGFYEKYQNSLNGDWNYHNPAFGEVTWFFEEGAFLEYICDYDCFFAEIKPFLESFFEKTALFEQLCRYQHFILRKPEQTVQTQHFAYDFYNYFADRLQGRPTSLQQKNITLTVNPAQTYASMYDYARYTVWFGRRRGATVLKSPEVEISACL